MRAGAIFAAAGLALGACSLTLDPDGIAPPRTFTVSGKVTGASSVTVSLSGPVSKATATDGSGNYAFSDLPDGEYTLTPSKAGYLFSPPSRAVSVNGADVAGQDFSGTAGASYSISGTVSGAVVSGVTMTLSGTGSDQTSTDVDGNFAFNGLPNGGSYTVTPSKNGYTFSPPSRPASIAGANVTGLTFTSSAVFNVSGRIAGPTNTSAWVEGITMALAASSNDLYTTQTDSTGYYQFTGVSTGTYTLHHVDPGYTAPSSPTVVVSTQDVAVNPNYQLVPAITSYAVSGNVSYGGTKTGRIYVSVRQCSGTCDPSGGTSIPAKGGYVVQGLPSGTYRAIARMDVFGKGIPNASDPIGILDPVTIGTTNATGKNITLTDPTPPTPVTPGNPAAVAGNGTALVIWDTPRSYDSNLGRDVEIATSYKIYWGTDTNASNGGTITVNAGFDGGHYIHSGLQDGATYYYKISALVNATESAATSPIPVKVGAPSGGITVSGSISYSGTATGPLYVVVQMGNNGPILFTRIPTPSSSPVAYSISGLSSGQWNLFAFMDANNDGVVDDDVSTGWDTAITVGTTNLTGQNLAFPTVNVAANTSTEHTIDPAGAWYNVNWKLRSALKRPVAVTLFSGKYAAVPMDFKFDWDFYAGAYLGATRPQPGDTFKFKVTYSDGTSEIVSSAITSVLDSPARNLSVISSFPYSAGVPLIQWQAPSSPPSSYGYVVKVDWPAWWWYPDSDAPMSSTITYVEYNYDGRASPASLGSGTYRFSVGVEDANGNMAWTGVNYTVP